MANAVMSCHNCGASVELAPQEKIRRNDECRQCSMDLHVCRNCRFFDPGRHNQCAEPQAEWVADKEKANFCDYFEPALAAQQRNRGGGAQDARKRFDDLFR